MKKLIAGLVRRRSDLALCAGFALIAAGCAMIYLPAGLIVLGIEMVAGTVLSVLGGGKGDDGTR